MSRPSPRILITCEHASNALPREVGDLGLSAKVLRSHRGYDVGAVEVARLLARSLRAPLQLGKWSRLLVDLNRSADHPAVIAERVDGRVVSGNQLSALERAGRIERYWQPYRRQVEGAARAASARGVCVHLSVHSFVERLRGVERTNDVGLLYDPARPNELALALRMQAMLKALGLRVRRNFPYFGNTDGLTTTLRRQLPADRYLGIEVELNQRLSRTAAGQRRLAAALLEVAHTLR